MTVTLFIEQRKVRVDNSRLQNSELVKNVVTDLGQQDVDITVPSRYLPVIDYYLDFIDKVSHDEKGEVVYPDDLLIIDGVNDLFLCSSMETFFGDNAFFVYLMDQAYSIWNEFYPIISLLPDERLIYLYTPYEFVPEKYMDRESFFKEWLHVNANKNIVLNSNEIYHTDVKYYDNGRIKELKIYLTIDGQKVGFSHEKTWYDSPSSKEGQPRYQCNYKDGQLDGLLEIWYEDAEGQLEYRENYKDGKRDGLSENWYENGQPKYRWIYKDGEHDGLHERWYRNGQLQYQENYKDGKEDGLWEGWRESGQLSYQEVYDMGELISEEDF